MQKNTGTLQPFFIRFILSKRRRSQYFGKQIPDCHISRTFPGKAKNTGTLQPLFIRFILSKRHVRINDGKTPYGT